MGTKMGYAPGTRIQLKDNSAYTVVQNPNTVAGIVGYASKGELNKIIPVSNTGELGVKLGYGYQSYKYNQGMYAANAVLTAGGEVEFVRPYGEEISRTDAYKRDLKTDAFVVAFDKNAALYDNNKATDRKTGECLPSTSLNVKHFAATRFKTDGAAEFGVTRKINNIAETIEMGNNVQFNVDASENFADSKASRLFDNEHCTDMVMFAIMNRDPSYANRAYDRYEIVAAKRVENTTDQFACTLAIKPIFSIGDQLLIPNTTQKLNIYGNRGTSIDATAEVVAIDDKVVTIKVPANYGANIPEVLIFNDAENAIADGFDYLNIKTAVAGNSVKNISSIKFGANEQNPRNVLKDGTILTFRDKSKNEFYVRLIAPTTPFANPTSVAVSGGQATITLANAENFVFDGDTISLGGNATTENNCIMTVQSVAGNSIVGTLDKTLTDGTYEYTEVLFDTKCESVDGVLFYADVTGIMTDDTVKTGVNVGLKMNTWFYVTQVIADAIQSNKKYLRVALTNDIIKVEGTTIYLDPSASYDYSIGDVVAIVKGDNSYGHDGLNNAIKPAFDKTQIYTITAINPMAGTITVDATKDITVSAGTAYQLVDLTSTNATVYNTRSVYSNVVRVSLSVVEDAETHTFTRSIENPDLVKVAVKGTQFEVILDDNTKTTFTVDRVDSVDTEHAKVYEAAQPTAPVGGSGTVTLDFDFADMIFVSSYSLYVSKLDQEIATFGENSEAEGVTPGTISTALNFIKGEKSVFVKDVIVSPTVLADSDIGASFMSLGLAKNRYVDINFDGNPMQVFTLTDDGIIVARMFMSIRYRFNGKLYEFEGTVVPYNYNGRQLSIIEAAEYELEDSGLEFVINDSGVLDYFLENNSYDLSQTIQNGVLNGSYTAIAYNEDDPAIVNDAVWTYDPQNNNSGSTLSTVWNLFVNKDASDVDMLVAAGVDINSPFTRKYETLNTQVMQAMINVCEARKDCFCLFDGVYEPDINKAVKKMISAGQLSLGRWGFIYDGRGVFTDSIYTQSQVDVMKSVQLAAIITANRQGGIWWIPPSGDEAYVPAAWGTKERFTRTYNSEDKNCDHAKLSDIHVNATRVNKDGIRIWGDWTLQMEDTAFNQVHVTMLVAGIHKIFYKYLDHKVFKLNTTVLRAQITSDLQEKLNNIKRQNPPGLIDGKVICNDSNNTPETIDQNFLFVDLKLLPPKSTRWIILRTSVESTKNGKTIKTELLEQE